MISHYYRSKSDIENLSKLRTVISQDTDPFDYRRIVVNKPWGYEYLLFQNESAAVWVLYLTYNHQTSMHCHPNKKSSLVVLSGEVVCSTLEGWLQKNAGEGIIIDSGVFHSTKAVSKRGALIIEVESPVNKKDLVRLKDAYGREHQGYEGTTHMSKDLTRYEYADFHSAASRKKRQQLGDAALSIRESVKDDVLSKKPALLCVLRGSLTDADGRAVVSVGELVSVEAFAGMSRLHASDDILYLAFDYDKTG